MREQDEILVVDDELIVLKLLTDILSVEGFQVQSADTGEMAVRSVASKPPHLILLDIKMPGMDGFEVCRRLKSKGKTRDIPLIFLSAITDFEQKMKGFELGAVDFITKPFQHEDLLARVRTHLELSRLRTKLKAQVAERTTRLRMLAEEVEDLYDNAPCGYHSLDEDGIFLRINSTELDWLGYTRNELIGKKKFSDLIAPRNLSIFRENFSRFKIQGFLQDLELEIIRQDGTTFPALLNASGIPDSQGNYLMIRSILSDITNRKQVEEVLRESEEKYRTLFEHTGTALIILEEDTTVSLANNEFATLTGYTKAEIEGNKKSMDFAVPQDKDKILGYHRLRREYPAAAPREYESRVVDKNGKIIRTHNTVAMIPGTAKSIVSFIDITERKRAEEELQKSEALYRSLFENMLNGFAYCRILFEDGKPQDFIYLAVNKAFESLTGLKDVIGRKVTEVIPGIRETDPQLFEIYGRVAMTGQPERFEMFVEALQMWFSVSVYSPAQEYFVAVFDVITERKRTEEALRESEKKYRDLYNFLPIPVYEMDLETNITSANRAIYKTFGGTEEDLKKGLKAWQLLSPEEVDKSVKNIQRLLKGEQVKETEYTLMRLDGSVFPAIVISSLIYRDGKPVGLRGAIIDITERKRAENALRTSEEWFRKIFEEAHQVGIVITSPSFVFEKANPAFCRMMGYSADELRSMTFDNITHPDHLKLDMENVKKVGRGEILFYQTEKKYLNKSGKVLWGNLIVSSIRDEHGTLLYYLAMVIDITEQKKAVELLLEANDKYQDLAESISDIFFAMDKNLRYTYWNKASEKVTGIPAEEALGKSLMEIFPDNEARKQAKDMYLLTIETKKPQHLTVNYPSDDLIVHEINSYPTINGISVFVKDITERKRTEEQLQLTLDSLRRAVGTTIQVMGSAVETRDAYTAGHQLRSADLARAIAAEMGLTKDQIDGIRMAGSIHDIGKLSIPSEILSKPTKLTEIEFALIKQHPLKGYEILKNVDSPWPLAQIVYQHHERMDGSGYPRSLRGNDILMEARILAVADVVEAMASHRPYRPALGIDVALDEISQNRGILYDPEVVDACLRLFKEKGFKLE